jgi:hypothetical protein
VLVFVDDGMTPTTLTCGLLLVKDKTLYRIEHDLSQSKVSTSPVSCILQSTINNNFLGLYIQVYTACVTCVTGSLVLF